MSYRNDIVIAANLQGLDPNLVEAIVEQESSGRFYAYRFEPAFYERYLAHSPTWMDRKPQEVAASYGLMQVMFVTAVEHGFNGEPWDLFSPRKNLNIGCTILAGLFTWARANYSGLATQEETQVRRKAVAAYNGGKGNWNAQAPQQYAAAVLGRWDRIRRLHA